MAEGARLESVFTGNRNVGSNPTPSATLLENVFSCRLHGSQKAQDSRCSRAEPLHAGRPQRGRQSFSAANFL